VERFPEIANDLVRSGVTIIAAVGGANSALAAKNGGLERHTIVFVIGLIP
jgi:hypothetical protein